MASGRIKRSIGVYTASAYSTINRFLRKRVVLDAENSHLAIRYDDSGLVDKEKAWLAYANELTTHLNTYALNSSDAQAKQLIAAHPAKEKLTEEQRIPLFRGIQKFGGRDFEKLTVKGHVIVNRDFWSTTESMEKATTFALLDANSDNGQSQPDLAVLLEIDAITATSVEAISLMPGENEWTITPGRIFKVVDVGTVTEEINIQSYDEEKGQTVDNKKEYSFPRIHLVELAQNQLFADQGSDDFKSLQSEISKSNRNRIGTAFNSVNYPSADLAEVNCTAGTNNDLVGCIAEQLCLYQKNDESVPKSVMESEDFLNCTDRTAGTISETCMEDERCIETFIGVQGDTIDWNGSKFDALKK